MIKAASELMRRLLTQRCSFSRRSEGYESVWMDHSDAADERVHRVADCRAGRCCGEWLVISSRIRLMAVAQFLPDGVPTLLAVGVPRCRRAHAAEPAGELQRRDHADVQRHGTTDIDDGTPTNETFAATIISGPVFYLANDTRPAPNATAPTMYDIILDPQTSATINLLFTYLFTGLVLYFLHRNFHRFVTSRQAFSLRLIHSVSARTVLVTNLPPHLRGDKVLADYFESCKWNVESVSVCREVEPLRKVLEKRTDALLQLEKAWAEWVGNPAKGVTGYDPDMYAKRNKIARSLTASPLQSSDRLIDIDDEPEGDDREGQDRSLSTTSSASNVNGSRDVEGSAGADDHCHVHTTRPRPTFRPRWFGAKVDSIEYWEKKFDAADDKVRLLRKKGKFEATQVAFVTFEHVQDAVSVSGASGSGADRSKWLAKSSTIRTTRRSSHSLPRNRAISSGAAWQ